LNVAMGAAAAAAIERFARGEAQRDVVKREMLERMT